VRDLVQVVRVSWPVYLRLGRVSNLPTVWTNVLAGVALSGASLAPGPLALLALALSLFYIGGMYLNDAFDREIDSRERPERPIPAGLVSATTVFAIGYGLLAAGLAALAAEIAWTRQGGFASTVLSGLCLAAIIVFYDARHKANPWGPLLMGLCRVLVYATAALAVAGQLGNVVLAGAAVLLSYLIGLTYAAKQESLATVKNLWPLLFLAAPFVYGIPTLAKGGSGAALYLGFLAWVGYAVWLLVRPGRPNFPRAVVSFIAGISLLDGLLMAGAGAPGAAVWGAGGFGLTLALQRYVRGT
jgi:4-hydroxybenzoate polyprenyltransferase